MPRRPAAVLLLLALVAPLSGLAGLLAGSVPLAPREVTEALLHPDGGPAARILWELRMPRVAAAFACGALLSLAGVMLQALVRNPLAEPYILGVSGGAALAALGALLAGTAPGGMQLAAFLGALGATAVVFVLSGAGRLNPLRLLLTGVVLSAGFGAAVSLLLALAPAGEGRGMLFWLMGDLGHASLPALLWATLAVLAGLCLAIARALDVLSAGEMLARALGVAVEPVKTVLYLGASLATAVVVAQAGPVGFVGLIVPHALRLAGLASHRWLVPGAVLAGGAFLTLADLGSRTLAAPQELPVGVFTALLGVPLLLWLLSRRP